MKYNIVNFSFYGIYVYYEEINREGSNYLIIIIKSIIKVK